MLEQLVESKSNTRENRTRGGFLLTTFTLVAILCFSAVLWSLFAMNVGIGNGELEISSLVAPIAPAAEKPAPPEPVEQQENQSSKAVSETTRQTNMLQVNENTIVPDSISVVPNTQKARPNSPFKIAPGLERDANRPQGVVEREPGGGGGTSIAENVQPKKSDNDDGPELVKPPVKVKKPQPPVSKGVINGQAKSLPKPVYSAAAKAVKAAGEVQVQVTIDESGKVISAKAVSGHALLRDESERAARNARFTPTFLSNEPVKVTGIIVYKFALQ